MSVPAPLMRKLWCHRADRAGAWMTTVSPGLMRELTVRPGWQRRLGQGGVREGDTLWDVVQDLRAHSHITGHGAVNQVAVALAMRAHVIGASQAVAAAAADEAAVSTARAVFCPADYVLAHIDDCAAHSWPRITGHWIVQL